MEPCDVRDVDEKQRRIGNEKCVVLLQDHFDLNLTDTHLDPTESMNAHSFWSQNTSTWIQL